MFENNIFYWKNKTKRHYIKIIYLLKIILMKKLTIIIIIIWTILLSWCWANQKQVSSENKNLSQEKVTVNKKVKNISVCKNNKKITKDKFFKYIINNNIVCVEKYIKEWGDVNVKDKSWWDGLMYAIYYWHKDLVKLLLKNWVDINAKDSEWKTALEFTIKLWYKDIAKLLIKKWAKPIIIKQNEVTEQKETDDTGVTVEYKIQELIDYKHCLINKEDFENMQKAIRKLFTWDSNDNIILSLKYKDLCLPKYKLIWTIKRWDPDTITVESCHDWKPYTLKNFKKWDKKFEYNIAYGYGNVCTEDNISYKSSFYKDWEKLNKLNLNKSFFQENEFNIFYQKDNKIYSFTPDNIDHYNTWKIKWDKLINAIIWWEWWDDYYSLYRWNYYKNTYISLFIERWLPAWNQFNAYTLLDNGDVFIWANIKDIYNNIPIFQKININNNNIKFQDYISDDKYKKYLISWYDLCFFLTK